MHWEALPHPAYCPDLAPSDFNLFGPIKEAIGGKRLKPTMKLKIICNVGWKSITKFLSKGE
jgi:hypothetical protein